MANIRAVVLALTTYKVLDHYRGIQKEFRSKLLDVFWVDGSVSGSFTHHWIEAS